MMKISSFQPSVGPNASERYNAAVTEWMSSDPQLDRV